MEKLFNEKRLHQVNGFIRSLSNDWSSMTNKQIRYKFFNKSRSFTDEALRILEENNIIEIDRSAGRSYVDGKWAMNSHRYKLSTSSESKVISQKSFFNEKEGRVVRFKYKGIYDVTETFTQGDKGIVKKVKQELCGLLDEAIFINICSTYGMSKEKAWFFYDKLST
jgi:hypothetical protein